MLLWPFSVFWALAALGMFGTWVFVLVLGPNRMFRDTVVERAYVVLTETLPCYLERCLRRFEVGEALAGRAEHVWGALFGRRNPLFQITAVVLYWAGLAAFFTQAAPFIPNRYVTAWQWIPICATLVANIGFYTAACVADPGIVDAANVEAACQLFDYDRLLFFDSQCRTCMQRKPARSKHCSACQCCVQMMDHHCIWLNNCVGLRNTRWFLGFLATFCVVCFYGLYLTGTVVLELRHVRGLVNAPVIWDEMGNPIVLSFKSSVLYLFDDRPLLAVLFVLLLVLAPAIGIFTAYQLRITMLGYTSNEESKWLNVADAIADGVVFAVQESDHSKREIAQVIEKEDQPADLRPRRQITHLRDVHNMYNRGVWNNFKFVLFPPLGSAPCKPHAA
ncbi:zf-DHHC-domain-containing protein [Coemansia reversa NRRL 1564]|uniref:Palmitoyltransferase n=1 Tax=Coemansia reversa (strain ATCC 12441 / NRRL 1564) TaxID=763665 RepID=A0A2G5B4V4_COERN|nr:zf-DHHC-domain-containing protein [Coemansia reversa NRRL 1564]|eukprot:PIA14022.1 zf-DHHC-domain-containing protein [Coemansia reversa NRRL 1564]